MILAKIVSLDFTKDEIILEIDTGQQIKLRFKEIFNLEIVWRKE